MSSIDPAQNGFTARTSRPELRPHATSSRVSSVFPTPVSIPVTQSTHPRPADSSPDPPAIAWRLSQYDFIHVNQYYDCSFVRCPRPAGGRPPIRSLSRAGPSAPGPSRAVSGGERSSASGSARLWRARVRSALIRGGSVVCWVHGLATMGCARAGNRRGGCAGADVLSAPIRLLGLGLPRFRMSYVRDGPTRGRLGARPRPAGGCGDPVGGPEPAPDPLEGSWKCPSARRNHAKDASGVKMAFQGFRNSPYSVLGNHFSSCYGDV